MDQLNLGLVGCGGMGTRHVYGIKETNDLQLPGVPGVRLAAVCDLNEQHAQLLADIAATELGERPGVFTQYGEMLERVRELDAVDVTTDTRSHHATACAALATGRHVLVEKPMALTAAACNQMLAAAEASGRMLAVAENYRRDPIIRLVKALLDGGAIGTPWMLVDASVGGAGRIVITPWRHQKRHGCAIMDIGVHNVDLMLYYLGEIQELYAATALFDRIRRRSHGPTNTTPFYAATTQKDMPEEIEADVEDTAFATLRFRRGALGQWTISHAGHGRGFGKMAIYGSNGSLEPAGSRSGRPLQLFLDDRREAISDERLFDFVPGFELDEVTARLFGGRRLASYELPYPAIDRKITATVLIDFLQAIAAGRPPEVGGAEGRHAAAAVLALFESAQVRQPVRVADVESGAISAWQRELNEDLGLADL